MSKKVVIENPEEEVPHVVLATAITKLAKAAAALATSGIHKMDLVALIQERAPSLTSKRDIRLMLECIDQIRKDYA